MTVNQVTLLLVLVAVFGFVIAIYVQIWREKKQGKHKVHGPHTPSVAYDQKEIVRSTQVVSDRTLER
ncbi:hypothetical protein [Flexibacterium corallicola]|uniref:hypothetical protein n=1 Tax=Flexibacterium corallicola TaxID=3037259 RepID=UPI00286EF809|nr:hypothetical protein [Pseudovibrio sp. M1P-2-3]